MRSTIKDTNREWVTEQYNEQYNKRNEKTVGSLNCPVNYFLFVSFIILFIALSCELLSFRFFYYTVHDSSSQDNTMSSIIKDTNRE
jgi:hypothetical protein